MNPVIFKDITTAEALEAIEKESETYQGLYVDMNDKEQRKYVKDKAANIVLILKRLDRARIDVTKDFKIKVDTEASSIKSRLEAANLPFTALIDDYKAERAKILAEKKAKEDAEKLAIQIEKDHEEALMIDKVFLFEKEQREREQRERDEKIKQDAIKVALEQAEREEKEQAEREEKARQERERNREYVRYINLTAKSALVEHGIDEETAKKIIVMIAKGLIPAVAIRY